MYYLASKHIKSDEFDRLEKLVKTNDPEFYRDYQRAKQTLKNAHEESIARFVRHRLEDQLANEKYSDIIAIVRGFVDEIISDEKETTE